MVGKCPDCLEMQKKVADYCCMLCALGLDLGSDNVIKDPFTRTIYVDMNKED